MTTPRGTNPKDHTPSARQVEADRKQMDAWLKKNAAKKLPPSTADHAVSIYVPFATMPAAKKGRRASL